MTCRSFQRFSLYLPDIFATMTEGTVWDPLRKKEVALTPEEHVRQWFIGLLHNLMHVPMHMMMSEVAFKLGAKNFRADILVYDRNASPLAVVECKRPETAVDSQVLDQAIRYNMVLDVRYIFITNGKKTFICRKKPSQSGDSETDAGIPEYEFISQVPEYRQMLQEDAQEEKRFRGVLK